jgi:uracil-DNA glycosylase
MDFRQYQSLLFEKIDAVFRSNPEHHDHRDRFPWLVGSLGDPNSGVFFVAENPSLRQVERAANPGGGEPTEEAQWFASKGDRLFRESLVASGFKEGAWDSIGGWNCYISNLIKEADYAEKWKGKGQHHRRNAAEVWAEVFRWELETARPRLVVLMGGRVTELVEHLERSGRLELPEVIRIDHYSYVAFRPSGKLGPMHPERVAAYRTQIADVRAHLEANNGP